MGKLLKMDVEENPDFRITLKDDLVGKNLESVDLFIVFQFELAYGHIEVQTRSN